MNKNWFQPKQFSTTIKLQPLFYWTDVLRTLFKFQAECVLIYMVLIYQISGWVFLIHLFLCAGFYCTSCRGFDTGKPKCDDFEHTTETIWKYANVLQLPRTFNVFEEIYDWFYMFVQFSGEYYMSVRIKNVGAKHRTLIVQQSNP